MCDVQRSEAEYIISFCITRKSNQYALLILKERESRNMRKAQKKQIEEFIRLLSQAHDEIKLSLEKGNRTVAMDLLQQCQQGALKTGELIEKIEEGNTYTILKLESYCELIYKIYEEISQSRAINVVKLYRKLRKALIQIENSVKNDIKVRLEVVFLPYKAAMWDSLESVWKAADADPECDAYVVPIPYYDKNKDGSFGTYHYEGNKLPAYVPVTHYEAYHLGERRPDVVFIHNPYDYMNLVTSIDPRFYSSELKKYTEHLVYIPYYTTSGGMSEGQALCPAYVYADCIIIQAEKYRKFFASELPDKKFVPLGSPKFDKVIQLCSNPPKPPEEWAKKMVGRKVYFYNTSIGGMLANTEAFLKKMEYVFRCFARCEYACLLWREHPLMESTFDSMRAEYKPIYEKLKKYFVESGLGIYDDTSEIEPTIALCDAYIGDEATSVTSLFGIVGKPMFILNNEIHQEPKEDDWRGEIINILPLTQCDEWMITQGNKLYHAPNCDYRYKFYCNLSEYAAGGYYLCVIPVNEKIYVCPANAQDILMIQNHKIMKRIELERHLERTGAFCYALRSENYIFLIPNQYPAIVRLDTCNDEVSYLYDGKDVFVKEINGRRRVGGSCVWKQYLLVASPDNNGVLAVDRESMNYKRLSTRAENHCGCIMMTVAETEIWLLPYEGTTITRWNPDTGEMQEYCGLPDGFRCYNKIYRCECMELPFFMALPYQNNILLSPYWGNMFVLLDKETGEMKEWKLPLAKSDEEISGYYPADIVGYFMQRTDSLGEWTYRYFHMIDRKLYDINLKTGEYEELPIVFDSAELKKHTAGFERISDWLMYSCMEDAFNSLTNFLENQITGQPFNRERQIQSYQKIIANSEGLCGEKVYQFIKMK